jgi:Uma2 family endonuclease
VEQYLTLTNQTNNLIEYADGVIDVLPMPTSRHQVILLFLYELFKSVLQSEGGKVLVAPVRLQMGSRRFPEPDMLMLRVVTDPRYQDVF